MIVAFVEKGRVTVSATGKINRLLSETSLIVQAIWEGLPDKCKNEFKTTFQMLMTNPEAPMWERGMSDDELQKRASTAVMDIIKKLNDE